MNSPRPPAGRRNGRGRVGASGAHASRLTVVGQLTAAIAHEINQPLGAILSNVDAADMLMDTERPPLDEIRRILGDIRRDGLRASGVIRNVRSLVRKRELTLERLDANALAADVATLLESETRQRRLTMTIAPADTPLQVHGDHALLQQMLVNLLLNALDSAQALSTLTGTPAPVPAVMLEVATSAHGEVEFHVVDAGMGVPPDRLEQLFDSFYTSKPHGMGLGLAIARSVVEAHGGRIGAENNAGAGARFSVTLPPYENVPE